MIARRKRMLQTFLNRISRHPILSNEHVFHRFLDGEVSWVRGPAHHTPLIASKYDAWMFDLDRSLAFPSHLLITQEYPQGSFTQSDRPICLVGLCGASHPVIHTFLEAPRSTFLGFRGVHKQVCCTSEWTDGEGYKEDYETVVRYVLYLHFPFPPTVIQVYSQITLTIMVNLVLP